MAEVSIWGGRETKFFFELTPERILSSIEHFGFRCTGRVFQLNSMENRVYEAEVELDHEPSRKNAHEAFCVAKFYRPGRWTKEQILEEHGFLHELRELEIPAVAPLKDANGDTLHEIEEWGIYCAVFPKVPGRSPAFDELDSGRLLQIGRLLGRMHLCGAVCPALHRTELNEQTFGLAALDNLLQAGVLPKDLEQHFSCRVRRICERSADLLTGKENIRLHGDCHLGNLLWGEQGPFWCDFDDMVQGPAVQDLWLIAGGRDEESKARLNTILEGYEQWRSFDYRELELIEALRALRMIHFVGWIAKRWNDPAFPRAFPQFGTPAYWREQLMDLDEQLELL